MTPCPAYVSITRAARIVRSLLVSMPVSVAVFAAPQEHAPAVARADWHRRLQWDTGTCSLDSPVPEASGVSVQAFGEAASLVTVECERWAYQGTARLYLMQAGVAHALNFVQFEDTGTGSNLRPYRAAEVTGIVDVEAASSRITVLRLYRGIGDCGQYVTYHIKDGEVMLRQLRVRPCADRPDADAAARPQSWPLLRNPPRP